MGQSEEAVSVSDLTRQKIERKKRKRPFMQLLIRSAVVILLLSWPFADNF